MCIRDRFSSEPLTDREVPDKTVTDEELLRQFVEAADRGALETLVRRYQHELYNFLRVYLADEHLAEDAFQLTFVNVYQKAATFDLTRRFRPWLYSVATHQAIDLKRRAKRRPLQSLDATGPADSERGTTPAAALPDHRQSTRDPLVDAELRESLCQAIEQIGEPGRSALQLVYLQELPYRDAAEILNVPVGTVKSRVHAAIRKLSAIWQRSLVGEALLNSSNDSREGRSGL